MNTKRKVMRYAGVYATSQIPGNCISKELHHTEVHGSKVIDYWEVWVSDPDEIKPTFNEDKEPDRGKIRRLDKFFRK